MNNLNDRQALNWINNLVKENEQLHYENNRLTQLTESLSKYKQEALALNKSLIDKLNSEISRKDKRQIILENELLRVQLKSFQEYSIDFDEQNKKLSERKRVYTARLISRQD